MTIFKMFRKKTFFLVPPPFKFNTVWMRQKENTTKMDLF